MRKLRVVELYGGIARTWESFRRWKRCELGLLVDVDQLAIDNYTDNHPTAPYWKRDLATVSPDELTAKASGRIDVLLGCPPCQGFSDTGKRDPFDPRNRHVGVFARFVCALKPLAVVMENVPLLAASDQYRRFTRRLEKAGYRWTATIVNASLYGSCQTRQRLLFVGIHERARSWPKLPQPTHGGDKRYFGYHSQRMLKLDEAPVELLGIAPATFQLNSVFTAHDRVGRAPIPTVGDVLSGLPPLDSVDAQVLSHVVWQTGPDMIRRMSGVPEGGDGLEVRIIFPTLMGVYTGKGWRARSRRFSRILVAADSGTQK